MCAYSNCVLNINQQESEPYQFSDYLLLQEFKRWLRKKLLEPGRKHIGISGIRTFLICFGLSLGWGNSVRLPREVLLGGAPFIIAYTVLLFLIGVPLVLIQVALGQFCRQSAHSIFRCSPVFKGAELLRCLASWVGVVGVGLHGALGILHMILSVTGAVPFFHCTQLKMSEHGYRTNGINGQTCIQKSFLSPPWENPLWYGSLAAVSLGLFGVVLLITRGTIVVRRSLIVLGLLTVVFLITILSLSVYPQLWIVVNDMLLTNTPLTNLSESSIWISALFQVLYSTNIGFGTIPILSGRFMYKKDAVGTSFLYILCIIISGGLSVLLYLVISTNSVLEIPALSHLPLPELLPLTEFYDVVIKEGLVPSIGRAYLCIGYAWMAFAVIITLIALAYSFVTLLNRTQSVLIQILGLVLLLGGLLTSDSWLIRLLETDVTPAAATIGLVFQVIGLIYVYGLNRLQSDLEFSIGRPVWSGWLYLSGFVPILITALFIWFFATAEISPALWGTLVVGVVIVIVCVVHEVVNQDDYNLKQKLESACRPSLEWGPEDPVIRHSWKQWTGKGTHGERDFTLRRRGTRDYTHSIKKSAYIIRPIPKKEGNENSSVFGDSAIEEDISLTNKSRGYRPAMVLGYDNFGGQFDDVDKSYDRKLSYENSNQRNERHNDIKKNSIADDINTRRISQESKHSRRTSEPRNSGNRNPLAQQGFEKNYGSTVYSSGYDTLRKGPYVIPETDHICWRRDSELTTDL